MRIVYFHPPIGGHSIIKVTSTVIDRINEKKSVYNVVSDRANLRGIVCNLVFTFKHRQRDSIHHITGAVHYCILALIGRKSVLTIHDTCGLDNRKQGPVMRKIMEIVWYRIPLKLATKVICISEVTKGYVSKYTSRKDLIVIHNAIDSRLKYSNPMPLGECVKILCVGTRENKNLLRTFAALRGMNCELTIIGELSSSQVESLKDNKIRYRNLVDISEEEINNEYKNTDIVSFVSLFEGFGMPLIEANQAGRPVIASNIPVLKEVGGDAALYVDPMDVESIKRGYTSLISDEALRTRLVDNGRKNVQRFNVDIIKRKWMEVYESIS